MIDLIEPTDTLLTGYYWDCVYNSGISVLLRIGPDVASVISNILERILDGVNKY
jgi:hypothetical protein